MNSYSYDNCLILLMACSDPSLCLSSLIFKLSLIFIICCCYLYNKNKNNWLGTGDKLLKNHIMPVHATFHAKQGAKKVKQILLRIGINTIYPYRVSLLTHASIKTSMLTFSLYLVSEGLFNSMCQKGSISYRIYPLSHS